MALHLSFMGVCPLARQAKSLDFQQIHHRVTKLTLLVSKYLQKNNMHYCTDTFCTALELISSNCLAENGLIAYTEVSFARDISSLVMFAFSHMLWKMCRASKSSKGVPNSST